MPDMPSPPTAAPPMAPPGRTPRPAILAALGDLLAILPARLPGPEDLAERLIDRLEAPAPRRTPARAAR